MANGLFKSSNAGAGALSSAQAATSIDIKTASLFNSQQKQVEEQRKILAEYNQAQDAPKDNGGFFGGIGYAFEKLGLGFLQSIEGIWDYTAGGLADLFGAHDWAEQQIANDWVNYGHADEWFNPSQGWQVVGDVAGGIGTSLPAIATVAAAAAIAYFSGGTLAPVAAGMIGGVVAGLGAAGTATKEAYRETGQLTGKEWGYGTLSGFTEGAMEGVSDAIGFGVGSIAKNLAGSTAKASAKAVGTQVAKSAARQTFGKTILKSFLSEAFEEGVQELLDPVWKRITYDPNAENATFQQVAYAALVGGLSGAIMGGADVSVRNGINYFHGSKVNANGGVNGVISLAEEIARTEGVNQSGNAQVEFVVDTLNELQESLKSTGGEVKTAKQKMLVGVLSKANTAAPLSIVVHQNADAIIADAETTVKRLNDIGYKTSKGEAITVEMLLDGVKGERGTTEYRKSISEAMRTNEALRSVAVMSAAGQLNMDAARFQQSTLRGEQLFNQSDLNHFVESATEAQKRDVGERLGITDWATVTADELKSRIVEYSTNGGMDQYINERNEIKKLSELEISKKGLPKYVGSIKQDGAVRYKFGDASVAIVKNGDTYLVYDYARDVASKPLTKTEANRVIKEIYAASLVSATDSDIQTQAQQETQQLDTFARENIPDYKKLVGAQQQAVRQTLRQARAAGVSEADQILYASVAARSGVNIEFVSAETLGANADAGYSLKDGKILVNREIANNPKARTAAKILLHEFTHGMIHRGYAVRGKKGDMRLENKVLNDFFTTAIKGLSAEQQIEILTPYVERHGVSMQDFLDGKVDLTIDNYIELREEIAAHFVERELGSSAALQRIISDKPTFKDKLLSFLKRAKADYSSNEKLSRAANALLKKYQKFFNQYSSQNRFSPTVTSDLSAYQRTQATGAADTNADTQTRFSIKKIDGKSVVVIDTDQHIFDGVTDPKELRRIAREYILNNFRNDVYKTTDGKGVVFTRKGAKKITNTEYLSKIRISTELDNFIKTAEYVKTVPNAKSVNPEFGYFDYYRANFMLDGKMFNCLINVGINTQTGAGVFYEITQIKEAPHNSFGENQSAAPASNGTFTNIIPNNGENVNPDGKKSDTKRYALKIGDESVAVDVEETRNLVALHNLSEDKLLKVIKLGGFPMPSIAITKADMEFTDFGEITVVFGRETIDPANPANRVYERDAWTPMVPRAEYKINETKAQEIIKRLTPYVDEYSGENSNIRRFLSVEAMQDSLNNNDGDIAYDFAYNYETKYAFLRDTGVISEYATKSEIDTEITARSKEYKAWLDKLFENIAEKKGVRNRTSEFAPSGSRRSFEETHYDYTLKNIVDVMRTAPAQGADTDYASPATLSAALARNFTSIEDIKQAETMLSAKNSKQIAAARNEYEHAISEIVDEMAGRSILAQEGAEAVLMELARSKKTTAEAILSHLQKEYKGVYNFTAETAQKISTLFNALKTTKTDMFEAKPRRAVELSEIKQVLIPLRYPNQELLQALKEKNIPYTLYEKSFNDHTDERSKLIQKMDDIRFALAETDSEARTLTEEQCKFFQNSKFTDKSGHLLTLYHQTASEFTIFDTSIKGTGQHDYLTPFGIFMKPSAKNIGIKGNIQMALYGNVVNPIEFADRAALESYLREAGFGEQIDGIKNLDTEYQTKSEAAEKRYMDLATKAYKNPENKILQSQLETAEKAWSDVIDEWGKAFDKRSAALKELVNKHFRTTQYDGIILRKDSGSFGRETMAYIAFEPNQVKSVSNTSPTSSTDIRFALSGEEYQERVKAAQDMRDEARGYKRRLKINSDGSVTVYHGTSAKNADAIRSTGVIKGQSYFTTNAAEAYYYAHQKNKGGVVLEIHADARALEFAAAGAEIFAPSELTKVDGVYVANTTRYALAERDSKGRKLSVAQLEYFKDTKVVDKNGRLLVVYHQTNSSEYVNIETGQKWSELNWKEKAAWEEKSNAEWSRVWKKQDFYIFDNERARKSIEMPAFFFSPEFDLYHEYGERTIEAYLLIKNPAYNPVIENAGVTDTAGEKAMQKLIGQGYDGFIRVDDDGNIYEYGVFNSNQIKQVSNTKPTTNADIRYALPETDSAGKKLSEQQRRFFNDSKIVDEQGRLLPVYHGSPKAGFTVFNTDLEGSYFTADRQYAQEYARGDKSKVYAVYLNIKKPFDTRDTAARKIFEKEFYGKWGNNTPLTERGLLDWTDGADMYDFLQEKGYDYDGIIIDEGGVPDANGGVRDRGISYVAFSPEQIKQTTNLAPTGDSDIRYALSEIISKYEEQTDVLSVYERKDTIAISNIVVKKNLRNNGIGQTILNDIVAYADRTNKTVTLTPTTEFGTQERLKRWYKKNGFVENKGRHTDFTISDTMYRLPQNGMGTRYALTDTNAEINPTESYNSGAIGGLSRGQRAKFVANNTKFKVYSKLDAASVIDSIVSERLTLRDGRYEGVLSGKNRAEVIEKLFTKLNSTPEGYRIGVALDIADYIIDNAILTDMYETYNDDSYAMGVVSVMRRYMHGINLSGIQSEIQHRFDKKNSINLVWGSKDGIAPDVVAQELESYGIHLEAINEADQFFEMLDLYESAKEQVNKRVEKIMLTAIGSKTEIEQLRQDIARDVLTAYDKKGTQSKYAKLVEKYTQKIATLKKDLSTAYKRNTLTNRIIDGAAYLRDIATKRNYVGAEIFAAPELTSWLKQLAKIKYRSDLRKSGVRKILLDYGLFYNTNNALLYDENPDLSYIDSNVIDALNFIRQNALSTKPLSMEELQAAEIIIASAKHLFNNYDQVIIEGRKAKITDLAAEGNEIVKKTKNRTSRGFFNNIYGVFNKIIEPRVVIKSLENFNPNGILTRAYNEITRGETEAGLLYIELTNDIDTYIKQHRRFKNRLTSQYVTIAGAELTVGQAISLYELSKRPQAQEGLYESGFSYIDKKGSKQTAHITEADITAMYDAFTDTDKGFIELVETFFNVLSKQVKTDADMQILGYTNTSEEFYYPIKRDSGTIAKNITDARSIMSDWANVYNFSFNKDVKTGAKNKLFVTDVYSIVTRHAKQLSTYAKMTVPLKNFSQIYAKNIGDKTNVVSIRNTINEQVWGGAEGYLSKLFSDIQGRATSSSIIEKMRGAYAKYQLGANLKVIVSQITSYPTAGIMLDTGVMAKGFVMKTNWAAMDKYCPYARVRNYERGIVKAEGVIDKIGKVGDVLTKPIQWTDRFTIGRLWNACQLQVQKDTGLKYGSVENMQKAGVMLEEVIRLTQPNYTNTERSELMRSDSDLVRSFTMFTSVPLKQLSRLIESFGEFNALRSLIKSGDTDATLSQRYKQRYKLAKKKLRRTLASVTIANLMYVLVGQFFKFLYNNMAEDDEEGKVTAKSVFLDMLKDFGSTTIGMLPIVRDVYSYFVDGYEINSFTADMLNSIIGSTKSLFELAQKAASGEEISTQEYMSIFRNSIYAIGQITGIPFRNINNTITGLVKRFSPSAAYSYTSLFYNHKYSTDIKDALKKGDYELAETIMGMMLKDDRTGGLSSKATRKLIELYDAGFTVLPKSIGDKLTYDGEEIQLTAAQRKAFKTVYSQANAEIEKLVSAEFASLPAEQQAKAIKLLNDAYYSKAQSTVLKVPTDNKIIMLSGAITPSALAPHLAAISTIESDTDKKGNVINGSKKAKIIKYVMAQKLTTAQKLLLILALGYTIKDGDIKGVSAAKAKSTVARYITNLKLSKAEKIALAEKCGLMVKNGRIYAR